VTFTCDQHMNIHTENETERMRLESLLESSLKQCQATEHVYLKEGALVMLLKNISTSRGLVNGSIGKVTGYYVMYEFVQITFSSDDDVIKPYLEEAKKYVSHQLIASYLQTRKGQRLPIVTFKGGGNLFNFFVVYKCRTSSAAPSFLSFIKICICNSSTSAPEISLCRDCSQMVIFFNL
jgi:hypothetical protein